MRRLAAVMVVLLLLALAAGSAVAARMSRSRHRREGRGTSRSGPASPTVSSVSWRTWSQTSRRTHPNIHVKVVGGISDDKIVAAIRGGNAPDVAHSFTPTHRGILR